VPRGGRGPAREPEDDRRASSNARRARLASACALHLEWRRGASAQDRWFSRSGAPASRGVVCRTKSLTALLITGRRGLTRNTVPQFTFSARKAGSTFECRLDRPGGVGSYGACASPRAYTTTVNGSYTFSVRASHSGSMDATGDPLVHGRHSGAGHDDHRPPTGDRRHRNNASTQLVADSPSGPRSQPRQQAANCKLRLELTTS
jgi:hypothetical protein